MKKSLRTLTKYFIILLLVTHCACGLCPVEREFNHPSRPSQVHGWSKFQHGSIVVDGEFVLTTGQAVDNGKTGVRITKVSPAKCAVFKEPEFPSAQIEFFNVPDGKIICQSNLQPGSAFLRRADICGEKFEWDVIGISAINASEGWVALELVK